MKAKRKCLLVLIDLFFLRDRNLTLYTNYLSGIVGNKGLLSLNESEILCFSFDLYVPSYVSGSRLIVNTKKMLA